MSEGKPYTGAVVQYVDENGVNAAIVTAVHDADRVDLAVIRRRHVDLQPVEDVGPTSAGVPCWRWAAPRAGD